MENHIVFGVFIPKHLLCSSGWLVPRLVFHSLTNPRALGQGGLCSANAGTQPAGDPQDEMTISAGLGFSLIHLSKEVRTRTLSWGPNKRIQQGQPKNNTLDLKHAQQKGQTK